MRTLGFVYHFVEIVFPEAGRGCSECLEIAVLQDIENQFRFAVILLIQ